MFIRGLERQLVVTSGLKEEVGGSLDLLETLITQYFVVTDKTTSLHLS